MDLANLHSSDPSLYNPSRIKDLALRILDLPSLSWVPVILPGLGPERLAFVEALVTTLKDPSFGAFYPVERKTMAGLWCPSNRANLLILDPHEFSQVDWMALAALRFSASRVMIFNDDNYEKACRQAADTKACLDKVLIWKD